MSDPILKLSQLISEIVGPPLVLTIDTRVLERTCFIYWGIRRMNGVALMGIVKTDFKTSLEDGFKEVVKQAQFRMDGYLGDQT